MATLNWIGKEKVINHHLDVPFKTLKHKYAYKDGKKLTDGTRSENKIIHGDNLLALKSLLPEYEGKIKCIYIDPPYNTGNESWVYNDNVNHPKINKWLGEVVGKEGEDLTRHDKWLCMMYPRMKLLHKLLRDDGVIFVSMDDNEQENLRNIMNEIFGKINFINNIIWQKKYSPQNDARYFSDMHDFIVCYAKNKNKWNRNLLPRTEAQNKRYTDRDNDPRGAWKSSDLSVKTYNKNTDYPITTPSGRIVNPPKGYCWRVSLEKFNEMLNDNRIWFGERGDNVPSIKRFLSEVQQGKVPVTLWLRDEVGDNQEAKQELKAIFNESFTPFETPKPVRLIDHILKIGTDKDSYILDSFAGSGTTAHAVLNLNKEDGGNRKFILVELEDYADTITAERVKRVINGYGKTKGISGSFEFLELGDPLFNDDGYINENQPIEDIRSYVYYSETRTNNGFSNNPRNKYYLGKRSNTAYYFYYEKEKVTTFDLKFASQIEIKADQFVVYADKCSLSERYLNEHKLIFKKIPRDITRI